MTETLDAILPLIRADYDRVNILLASLRANFHCMGRCWVVVPDADFDSLPAAVKEDPFQVIGESELLPELKFFLRRDWWRPPPFRKIKGWYIQQLAKLAIADRIQTPFYLTLDADVICARPVGYTDLIRDGKALARVGEGHRHKKWNRWAKRVLKLPASRLVHGVTPAILATKAVLELQAHVAARVPRYRHWRARRLPSESIRRDLWIGWRSHLLRRLPWTEYALYHTFLEANGRWDHYHVSGGDRAIYGHAVWRAEKFDAWDPARCFRPKGNAYFTLVQSKLGISAERVRKKLSAYMDLE